MDVGRVSERVQEGVDRGLVREQHVCDHMCDGGGSPDHAAGIVIFLIFRKQFLME